jgi:hypothetical protein
MTQGNWCASRASSARADIEVSILVYDEPSYTGFVFPLEKIYPACAARRPLLCAG